MGGRRARGSVYKRRRSDGSLEDVWTIAYVERRGCPRRVERAFTDKAASEALLAQRLRDAARDEVGIGDQYRRHRGRPLTEHVTEFLAGLQSRNVSARYRGLVRARLLRAFEAMGARVIGDLDTSRADVFLASEIDGGRSVKTRDHYAMTLRQFGEWLLDGDRAPRNPFRRLAAVATPADVRRERLALTAEQVLRLVAAASERPVWEYRRSHPQALPETLERLRRNGHHRGLLYLFAALTGLRRAECAGIRWADLQLTGEPAVTPRAATTKAKRRDALPLDARLAAELLAWRQVAAKQRGGRVPPATEAVFAVPKNLTEQMRKDAAHAEIALVDDHGRRLDFHALRATYATLVARAGVPMQVGRGLIRHVDPKLTARHYEKLAIEDLRAGSNLIAQTFWEGVPVAPTVASEPPAQAHAGAAGRDHDAEPRRATP